MFTYIITRSFYTYIYLYIINNLFFRDNLEWLARATNWAKLSATASLGVIHRGHETDALELMRSYLPPRENNSSGSSGYSEGGGLYALGLIHANHGAAINDYLLGQLKDAHNEVNYKYNYYKNAIFTYFLI